MSGSNENDVDDQTGERVPVRATGRGAQTAPANRFGETHIEADLEQVEHDAEYLDDLRNLKTEYLPDASKSIISENDSPDIPFQFSLNPYRGCLHGWMCCTIPPRLTNPLHNNGLRRLCSRLGEGQR